MGDARVSESLAFRLAWLAGSGWLRLSAGRTIRSLPRSGPEAAFHYPVIVRLPPTVAASVVSGLERMRVLDPSHYYYPAESMHITLYSVSRFLSGGSDLADRVSKLRAVIGSYPSFDVALCGLNVSPTTVFAQVVPDGRTFGCLREGLKALNSGPSKMEGIGVILRDMLPHANVARFSGRVTADYLGEISRSRRECFGRWTVRKVELVRTDTLLSREGSQVLERIPLATA